MYIYAFTCCFSSHSRLDADVEIGAEGDVAVGADVGADAAVVEPRLHVGGDVGHSQVGADVGADVFKVGADVGADVAVGAGVEVSESLLLLEIMLDPKSPNWLQSYPPAAMSLAQKGDTALTSALCEPGAGWS